MNQERMTKLNSLGFQFDLVVTKWNERFRMFQEMMEKFRSFENIPHQTIKREGRTSEEAMKIYQVRDWIHVRSMVIICCTDSSSGL